MVPPDLQCTLRRSRTPCALLVGVLNGDGQFHLQAYRLYSRASCNVVGFLHATEIFFTPCRLALGHVPVHTYYVFWVCVCSLSACNVFYCHPQPVWLYHVFPQYLINCMIFRKMLLNTKCVFWFSVQLLSETFLMLCRTERDIVISVVGFSCKVHVVLVRFYLNMNFLDTFSKNPPISNIMKSVIYMT